MITAIRPEQGATKALFAVAGVTVMITLLPRSPGITNEDAAVPALVMALVCAVVGAAIGVHRSHEAGSIDPFPALCASAACLLPTLWIWSGHPIDYLPRRAMSTYTPELMALAAVGMVLGSAVPFARHRLVRRRLARPAGCPSPVARSSASRSAWRRSTTAAARSGPAASVRTESHRLSLDPPMILGMWG